MGGWNLAGLDEADQLRYSQRDNEALHSASMQKLAFADVEPIGKSATSPDRCQSRHAL